MKKITIWFKLDKIGYEHNHIQDGWVIGSIPAPISNTQKNSWKNCKWLKYFAYLDGLALVEKTLQVD